MRRVKSVIIFGLTLLAALIVLDAYLQLAEIQTPMETRIDPRLGPTYIPHKRFTRFNEGFFVGEANALGYMGPSVPPRRSPGERRVLLLGDSYVLGHTVLPRQYFGRYLEADLSRATGERVSVLNFGKADFNFANMYEYYRDFAGTFDHDLALFFIDAEDIGPVKQVATELYPLVKLESDSLVIDRGFRSSRSYRFYKAVEPLFTRSAVLRLVFNSYKVRRRGELPGVLLDKLAPRHRSSGPTVEAPAPEPRISPVSRAILRELRQDPRNVLVIRKTLPPSLRRDIDSSGVRLIDLGAYFDSLQAAGTDPYYWPISAARGHWSTAMHPLIARFLADRLVRGHLSWPPAASVTPVAAHSAASPR